MTARPNLFPTVSRHCFRSLALARVLAMSTLSLAAGCTLDSRIGGLPPRDGSGSLDAGNDLSIDVPLGPTHPPITSADQLDLLFMIDNSASMQPLQAKLAQSLGDFVNVLKAVPGGLPSLHVGVISSSLGAGMYGNVPGCSSPQGDQEGFLQRPSNCTMLSPAQNFIVADHGTNNFSGDLTDAFSCLTQIGQGGCGFEHQFSSTIAALQRANTGGDLNFGFLRPLASLGIVMLTNEDDCSTPLGHTSTLFNPGVDSVADPSGLGGLTSYRCNEFGHLCSGAPPPHSPPALGTTVTLNGCTSSEGMSPGPGGSAPNPLHQLITVESFVSFLKGLKDYPPGLAGLTPQRVFVAALAGPSTPYIVAPTATEVASGGSDRQPSVLHSCMQNSGEYADPGVRIKNWVDAFGADGLFETICADDLKPAMAAIASALVGAPAPSVGLTDGGTMGTGGAPGTGGTSGTGGTMGTGGAPATEGSRVPCPGSPAAGSCPVEGLTCSYSTQTCVCHGGGWTCTNCPATQPAIGTACGVVSDATTWFDVTNPPLNCLYGGVTCSCQVGGATMAWGCGFCPAIEPTSGQSCGNTSFNCVYPDKSCSCTSNGWDCGALACPPPLTGPFACAGHPIITCEYPIEKQTCNCAPYWDCSCPALPPTDGSVCVGNPGPCTYSDQSCLCSSRSWHCAAACPSTQPADGAACSSSLSCGYSSALCHCAGNIWACS